MDPLGTVYPYTVYPYMVVMGKIRIKSQLLIIGEKWPDQWTPFSVGFLDAHILRKAVPLQGMIYVPSGND